jgi:hypothetical protein
VRTLSGSGVKVDLPQGWDGRIYLRLNESQPAHSQPPHSQPAQSQPALGHSAAQEPTPEGHRALHVANFPLPADPGDFGSGAIERMGAGDVLVVLLEYHPDSAKTALFANRGLPTPLRANEFSPNAMPKVMPGLAGGQWFFSMDGRAFCLFVVLGSHADRARLAPLASAVVQTIAVS